MTIQNIFNLAGLVINMIGAYVMYHYSPKVSSQLMLALKAEAEQMRKKDLHKNKMIRSGMLLLFIGFLFQFAAMLM